MMPAARAPPPRRRCKRADVAAKKKIAVSPLVIARKKLAEKRKAAKKAGVSHANHSGGITGSRGFAAEARHNLFRMEYKRNGGNATQAAITAGYSPATAKVQGCHLLTRLNLRSEIEAREALAVERAGLSLESTLEQLRRAVEFDPRALYDADGNLLPIHDLPDEVATVLAGLESEEIRINGVSVGSTKKIKWMEKRGAVDMALRYFGAYERDNSQRAANLALQINLVGTPPARVERDDD